VKKMGKKKKEKPEDQKRSPADQDYLRGVTSQVVSGTMGLMGFALTSIVGIWAGNPALVTLTRALVACAICAFIGRMLGNVGEICVREYVETYKKERPRPNLPQQLKELEKNRVAHEQIVDEMRKEAA
jgi:hypothetical protein